MLYLDLLLSYIWVYFVSILSHNFLLKTEHFIVVTLQIKFLPSPQGFLLWLFLVSHDLMTF